MSRHNTYLPHGVIPAVLLPFDADLAIDEAAFRKHLRDVAATEGISAITINAHSTEVASTLTESRVVLENLWASARYERGVDPAGCAAALDRASALMAELADGKVAPGIVDTDMILSDVDDTHLEGLTVSISDPEKEQAEFLRQARTVPENVCVPGSNGSGSSSLLSIAVYSGQAPAISRRDILHLFPGLERVSLQRL
jgi:hypothetical protein